MDNKQIKIKELEESIANNQKELKIMKAQIRVNTVLDELKEQYGDELENIVLDYFQFDIPDQDSIDFDSTDTDEEEAIALKLLDIKPEPKYSEYELHFYVKHYPKPLRNYKYGVKGIRYRPEKSGHPFYFQDWSWLTKKRIYRSFKNMTSATSYATGVWEKYPTDIVFEN
jgi:hypothetical protein